MDEKEKRDECESIEERVRRKIAEDVARAEDDPVANSPLQRIEESDPSPEG
jgi:hypothetical protein